MLDDIDLDHVAVAVERWADAWPRYVGLLGGEWVAGGGAPGFASAQVRYSNEMKVEVLAPNQTEQNDFLRRFLDASGPGPHHLTYKVPDLGAALDEASSAGFDPVGVDLRDPEWKEAFLHPKQAQGVVIQLAESHGSWTSPPPADLPTPEHGRPARLDHVAHAVADLDDGLTLFAGLLGGQQTNSGEDDAAESRWVDLTWPGSGRVRLVSPSTRSSQLHDVLAGRPGRVHSLAFSGPGADEAAGEHLGVRVLPSPQ